MNSNLRYAAICCIATFTVTSALAQNSGAHIYNTKCAICHGVDGSGTAIGNAMGAGPFDPAFVFTPDFYLFAAIKNGKNRMPAYAGTLTDDQINATVTYIRVLFGGMTAEQYRAALAEVAEANAAREAEAARAREVEVAALAAKFREDILVAWKAAEEPDPFASIRGDFDLSSSNSHQWKTSLLLQGAEKCALIKTTPVTPKSASAWTFACKLPATGDGYEGVVKTVQSILHLPFQPDERAMMINQVFFADPARPARRLFIAKIAEGTIGVSVVAVRYAGVVPGHLNAGPFPSLPTMLSATPPAIPPAVPPTAASFEPTIHDEVESIRNEPHGQMPPAQRSTTSGTAWGTTTMTVHNSTPYELTVLYDGPVSKKLTLAPGASQALDLAPGAYHVAGRVSGAAVLPFYGEESYDGSASYSESFYIAQR